MKINGIKVNGVVYEIWATSAEVAALNNQGNAALGKELESGKAMIAQAINNAGGTASADESLSQLAEDIEQIPTVNVSAFKFSEVPNLAKQIAEQTYASQLGEDFRTKLTEINDVNGDITTLGTYVFQNCQNLKRINLPSLTTTATYTFTNDTNIEEILLPSIDSSVLGTNVSNRPFNGVGEKVLNIVIGYADLSVTTRQIINTAPVLIRFELPTDYDYSIMFINWTASTYLTISQDQWENRLTLYQNLLAYTINRLYDHSQDGLTRTFRLGFYATLFADSQLNTEPYGSYYTPLIKAAAQACIDEATRKGWTLSA